MPIHLWLLTITVAAEVSGTLALQASAQFSKPLPSVLVVVSYALSFYFMSLTLRYMPVGIVYAIWSGVGIVAIAGLSWVFWGQKLDLAAVIGIVLIIAGVMVINLLSSTTTHS
ncbi:MAG: SMR family transporter [Pseudomonadota bacterium]